MRNEKIKHTHGSLIHVTHTKRNADGKKRKKIAHTDSLTELTQPKGVVSP